jgi:hypothetical protein
MTIWTGESYRLPWLVPYRYGDGDCCLLEAIDEAYELAEL